MISLIGCRGALGAPEPEAQEMPMRRLVTVLCAVLVAASLIFSMVGTTLAAGASISPASQSHAHAVKSTWTLTWSGYTPYEVHFSYGDGFVLNNASTAEVSKVTSHTFFPCVKTTYHQFLNIWDSHRNHGGDDSFATELGGAC
jgi:hypothetical protein